MEGRVGAKLRRCLWFAYGLLLCVVEADAQVAKHETPAANPARPTVSTPATLTPVGYLQFETGAFGATHSPEFSSLVSLNEVIKLSVARRLELLAISGPFVHSR